MRIQNLFYPGSGIEKFGSGITSRIRNTSIAQLPVVVILSFSAQ